MILGDRLRAQIDAIGSSQAALARAIGVSPQAVSKMVLGGTTDTAKVYQIARFLRTTPEYLTGESDEAADDGDQGKLAQDSSSDDTDLVEIDQLDTAFGLGGTFIDNDAIEIEKVKFSRRWLRAYTHSSPELLFTTAGWGDSMRGTIEDADIVICDRGQRELKGEKGDKIWACVFGGAGMIKRLRPLPDGTVRIMSDNQMVRDEIATDGDLHIVGRVVAVVKRL